MSKISIIIPARDETFEASPGVTVLQRTVQDILEKATGEIEIIVAFDGPPYTPLIMDDRIKRLEFPQQGAKINFMEAVEVASGKYIMKLDAHCMMSKGFDEMLAMYMQENWIMSPRYYDLNPDGWQIKGRKYCDYYYLPYPVSEGNELRFRPGCRWYERTSERDNVFPFDENMKLHGSCFFMDRNFFRYNIGGLDPNPAFSTWHGEDIEISMKAWLGPWDGKLIANKSVTYAHMSSLHRRKWGYSQKEYISTCSVIADYWMNNKWEKAVHDISWLVNKFSPVPTWPDKE